VSVPDNSLLRAAHRLSAALLSARTPEGVGAALMEELQAALAVDQVHLTEVSQDGDVGQGTVSGGDYRATASCSAPRP
jgi:GAF domain-containing protein